MLKNIVFIYLAFLLASCSSYEGQILENIKFDGVYRAKDIVTKLGPAYNYLRFYSDGKVKSTTLIGTPEEFWMATLRNNKYESIGEYKIQGDKISFSTSSEGIVVQYKGLLKKYGFIRLSSHSLSSGHMQYAITNFSK